jgi:uncharacterized OB-fold protein
MTSSQRLESARKVYRDAAPAAGEYRKPLPKISPANRPFFDAARNGELRLPRCRACSHVFYPPEVFCPRCLSTELDWLALSGKGTVWSFIVMYQRYFPAFADEIPYNVAFVRLDDAPDVWMCTNLVDVKHEAIACDMPVEAVFDPVTPDVTLVKFRPSRPTS